MDKECFELCKEVYEATGWECLGDDSWWQERGVLGYKRTGVAPLYTSDYLLEKLPPYLSTYGDDGDDYVMRVQSTFERDSWWAYYLGDDEKMQFHQEASTPLKALLRLTLALHEAGELKG